MGDLSVWVALGRDSLENLKIIRSDLYTVGPTSEMIYPAGLCLVYGLLNLIGGLNLVIVLHALVPVCWVWIWFSALKKKLGSEADVWTARTVLIFLVALAGASLVLLPRPALVATVPALLTYLLISQTLELKFSAKQILALSFIEIVWVNLHGSFILLPILLLWPLPFYYFEKKITLIKNRLLAVLAVTATALLNPFGWKIFPYIVETASVSKSRGFDEWLPTHYFNYPAASLFFYIFSVGLLICIVSRIRSKNALMAMAQDPFVLIWLAGFLAIRNTFLVFLFLPLFLVRHFQFRFNPQVGVKRISRILNTVVILGLTALTVCTSPYLKQNFSFLLPEKKRPVFDADTRVENINQYLNSHEGRIFNSWIYGSDLALAQKNQYYLDTRNIIFSDDSINNYQLFINQPEQGFERIKTWNFRYFLVHQDQQVLVDWLKSQRRFKMLLVEGPATLFEHHHYSPF